MRFEAKTLSLTWNIRAIADILLAGRLKASFPQYRSMSAL